MTRTFNKFTVKSTRKCSKVHTNQFSLFFPHFNVSVFSVWCGVEAHHAVCRFGKSARSRALFPLVAAVELATTDVRRILKTRTELHHRLKLVRVQEARLFYVDAAGMSKHSIYSVDTSCNVIVSIWSAIRNDADKLKIQAVINPWTYRTSQKGNSQDKAFYFVVPYYRFQKRKFSILLTTIIFLFMSEFRRCVPYWRLNFSK